MALLNFPENRSELSPPLTGDLQDGDIYELNGITYVYTSAGNEDARWQGEGGGGGSVSPGASVHVGDTPPASSDEGDLWFNTDDGRLYVYFSDVDNTSQWVDASPTESVDDSNYVKITGDTMTGTLNTLATTGAQQTITASAWDLSTGNNWTVGTVVIPQPTNGVTGQSGTLTMTAAPTSWPAGGALKYPGGSVPAPSSFPAVVPFYVKSPTEVLLGNVTEGIS